MRQCGRLTIVSVLLCLQISGLALAATPPAKVVEQYIEAHLQGRFAEARSLAMERANLSASLFSNWLFGTGGAGFDAGTADIFLSRKFAQAFRYSIVGTAQSGDNQALVTVVRQAPNMTHLFTWALAPKRGAAPYEIIDAVDTYLTKVNFPVEESRMQFTLVREVGSWYINAIEDEKFLILQRQFALQEPLSVAAIPVPGAAAASPGVSPGARPSAGSAAGDLGRQVADAQFHATLQGFNRTYQAPAAAAATAARQPGSEEKQSFFGKVATVLGFSENKSSSLVRFAGGSQKDTVSNIRDALARYATGNNSVFPARTEIYDWKSLHRVVSRYGKGAIPTTEDEAGFTFLNYSTDSAHSDYKLLVELREPQDGVRRVEITPYGVDRVN